MRARARTAPQTTGSHLQLYALNVSSEVLWRLPHGHELKRVNVYLSHSLHLDYGAVASADLGGDAKSLLVALTNGTLQAFSWLGKVRCGGVAAAAQGGGAACGAVCSAGCAAAGPGEREGGAPG